jgi:hypothetical protein
MFSNLELSNKQRKKKEGSKRAIPKRHTALPANDDVLKNK